MERRKPPELEMTLEGEFVSPPKPPLSTKIMFWAVLIAVLAGAVTLAALALWVALLVLPIAIGAALVGYLMFRYRMWRAGQQLGGGQRGVWMRPPGR
jgi:hypothetical protein